MYNFRGIQKTVSMIYLAMFHIFPGVGTLRRSRGTGPIIESEEATGPRSKGLVWRTGGSSETARNELVVYYMNCGRVLSINDVLATSRVKAYSIAMVHSSCFTGFHVREISFHSPRWIHIRSMTIKTHRNIEWWMIFYESFWSWSHSMEISKLSDNWMILGAHAILLHHHHHHHHHNNNNNDNNKNKSPCFRN